MDKLFIRSLKLDVLVGTLPQERVRKQALILDLEWEVDIHPAAHSDRLEDTIDYAAVVECVRTWAKNTSYELLETLAEKMAHLILQKFKIKSVKLTLCKPAAIAGAQGVGITITRNIGGL